MTPFTIALFHYGMKIGITRHQTPETEPETRLGLESRVEKPKMKIIHIRPLMVAISYPASLQPIPGLIVRGSQGFSLCEVYFKLFLSYFTGLKEKEGIYQ